MEDLNLEKSKMTPEIKLESNGMLSIMGRSLPEDVAAFYDPVSQWLQEYSKRPAKQTSLKLFFEYYNSSTARRITEIIFDLEDLMNNGHEVKVIWCYKKGDSIMKENGEEIKSVSQLAFELEEITVN